MAVTTLYYIPLSHNDSESGIKKKTKKKQKQNVL